MHITPDEWAKMDASIKSATKDLNDHTGITVVLWKLRCLMKGYFYALGHGYTGTQPLCDERETNP